MRSISLKLMCELDFGYGFSLMRNNFHYMFFILTTPLLQFTNSENIRLISLKGMCELDCKYGF
jgi:hypothetical protein